MNPRALMPFWWTFEEPVNASAYFRHGLGLAAIKFAGGGAIGMTRILVMLPTGRSAF